MMLETRLLHCTALPQDARAGQRLLDCLRSSGAKLLDQSYGVEDDKCDAWITALGNTWIPRGLEHPILAKGAYHHIERLIPPREHGTASFSYIHVDRGKMLRLLRFDQDLRETDHAQWDEIGASVLRFVKMMYPHLRPRFGWIDEFGDIETVKSLAHDQPRFLFWINVFGPELVQQIGKDFLLKAPGWKKEELDDGGILYVV